MLSREDLVMRRVLGWREWVALPELGIRDVKAKIDTGAKTSALHVIDMEGYSRRGVDRVRFRVHPDTEGRLTIDADARVHDWRIIKDSGGHASKRPIIRSLCQLGPWEAEIELSLTERVDMGFRMLIGRQALRQQFIVDPALSFVATERFGTASLRPWQRPT